tara:strand:- start:44 stop:193 length:150 start_codon:yes stop_codon:yes gene_type:complete
MDTKKLKAVLLAKNTYEEIKAEALSEGRSISSQLKFILERYKKQELSRN